MVGGEWWLVLNVQNYQRGWYGSIEYSNQIVCIRGVDPKVSLSSCHSKSSQAAERPLPRHGLVEMKRTDALYWENRCCWRWWVLAWLRVVRRATADETCWVVKWLNFRSVARALKTFEKKLTLNRNRRESQLYCKMKKDSWRFPSNRENELTC